MPADEVTHGTEVDKSRVRTGPRHAAPKKPLFTRFQMPAGKAIALAAMPTAVLMGMGFTPKLALAEDQPTSKSLTADEYKECVAALEDEASASASPSPSASASESDEAEPSPSESSTGDTGTSGSTEGNSSGGKDSSSDSGSDDEPTPTPSASASGSGGSESGGDAATPSPSPSESGGGLLEDIGDAISDIFTGGQGASASASPSPSATPSASASESAKSSSSDAVKETTEKVTDTVEDTVKDTTDTASKAAEEKQEAVKEAAEAAGQATESATPSPSASATTDADGCPVATDEEGGVDNTVPLPDDPWYLDASSLTLRGADYQGIVEVRTANGTKKKVLKYVISDGTDIGDLHQTVKDKQSGKTYHVQAAKGSTSTITGGKTVMYTESISGNLLGLIPLTFDPEHPPPLNIPLIIFTNVKVVQAGQFGGDLTVPGLHSWQD
ncbi:hypothetical protein [Streptomyces sp. GESEQ-4]|uniref:hypothetical protein n=1 Tax=Streptomyces sp. GESEQ-4 TaxID=2812655 RepID=UPI001B3419D4|nr:hypothetical protein [Streptomyces sp. GESEQ-4]